MANYWAITIGINQYRHLQPLMHAQNDALFMHRFLTETAGIPAEHCALLSDLATSVGHQVVYPDKPALSEWVQTITQQVTADDVLWFFFSGYGVQLEGNDYLMPIDGDPGQIKETGLAVADLIETLAQLPTNKTVLVLDINRSQGSFAGQAIGAQVISLAEANELPLLLSCQPEQYSHETFGVRHGLFTAALLEALQQKCSTLGAINDYVSKRLPELCEHHWRPIQNPVCVMGDAQRVAVVVPENQPATDVDSQVVVQGPDVDDDQTIATVDRIPVGASAANGEATNGAAVTNGAATTGVGSAVVDATAATSTVLAGSGGTLLAATGDSSAGSDGDSGQSSDRGRRLKNGRSGSNESALAVTNGKGSIVAVDRGESRPGVSGAKLRNWCLAALALLMVGVLLKQPFVRTAWVGLTERIAAIGDDSDEAGLDPTDADLADADADPSAVDAPLVDPPEGAEDATPATDETAEPDANEDAAEADASESQSTDETDDDAETADDETADAEAADDETADDGTVAESPAADTNSSESASPSATGDSTNNEASTETKVLLAQANTALSQRQYSEALITLQQVPKAERDSAFASILTKARAGAAEAQQYNASVLTDARTSIQPTQASQFSDAIAKARRIQPGEPYYEEAQQDIRSWSQIILDIAEGRATSGNLDGAIAAANVMPYDNSEFHQKAQNRIEFWQQRQNSRGIIVEAQSIPRSGQASTYQKGIVKLREVPIEHPEYETAQRLADEWSERIFSIAQARAAQGRRSAAIQAAVLVPAGTTSYEPTQQAIKRWRSEE